jgi:hypothetical protein
MSKESFPNHTGGVVQVRHASRWGTVAEALIEDDRLSLDTRAVAAWLAIKPAGWQIVISVLTKRMRLGKERWQRIARELEAGGYLSRSCRPGASGRWEWQITFDPAGGVVPDSGRAASGDAGTGESGNKVNTPQQNQSSNNTITTGDTSSGGAKLQIPALIQCHEQMLLTQLSPLPIGLGQEIVNEFVGVLNAVKQGEHVAIHSPRAWIASLVRAALAGEFTPEWGERGQRAIKASLASAANQEMGEAKASEQRAKAGLPERQSSKDAMTTINKVLGKVRGSPGVPEQAKPGGAAGAP